MVDPRTRAAAPDGNDRIPGQPDVNQGAPRPSKQGSFTEGGPDMDHPPRAKGGDAGFDLATAAEEDEARDGTLPNSGARHTAELQRAASAAEAAERDRDAAGQPDKSKP